MVSKTRVPKGPEIRGLGLAIEAERDLLGMNREQFAARTGINVDTLKNIENGYVDIGVTRIIAVSEAIGIHPSELLRRAYEKTQQLRRLMSEEQATNVVKFEKRPQDMTGAELDALTIDKAAVEYNDESTEPEAD